MKNTQEKIQNKAGGTEPKSNQSRNDRKWYLIDAKNKILGRLSTKIAKILMGKEKVDFARHADMGDAVIVINAAKVAVTGTKEKNKIYYRYSGYPGGLRETTLAVLRVKKPEELIYHAVSGMLPKNRLGKSLIKKLYVYPKEEYPHEAQKQVELEVN